MEVLALTVAGAMLLLGLAFVYIFSKDQGRRARARYLLQIILRR
jgi:hypothetical protein